MKRKHVPGTLDGLEDLAAFGAPLAGIGAAAAGRAKQGKRNFAEN